MDAFMIPRVTKIIHRTSNRGEFFTVVWEDNTKTTVKLAEGDTSDEYTAFLYALGKKLFGDKGNARKFIAVKKEVFESECRQKSLASKIKKNRQAYNQKMASNVFSDDIEEEVYRDMFIQSALLSKNIFRR